jgi:exodeoxyribonuclease VII small subunit
MEQPQPSERSSERSYEQLVQDLEVCVRDLEEGRLPLEKAIDRFKEGVALVKLAEQRLQAAEGQVNLLLRGEEGQDRKEPFAGAPTEAPRGPRLATSAPAAPQPRPGRAAADDDFPT